MNMPHAALRIPPSTASTGPTSTTTMCEVTDRPRSGQRSTAMPMTTTISEPASATVSVIARSRMFPPVPDSPHRLDPPRIGGIVLHLLPQPAHVDGDRRLVAPRPPPDLLPQLRPPKPATRMPHQ